jgi:hypothetical protein
MRIHGQQAMIWKGTHGIPLKCQTAKAVPWKKRASAVDYIQLLPRELQSEVFEMGRMDNPINSKNTELRSAALTKSSSIQLTKLFQKNMRPFLDGHLYAIAKDVYEDNLNFSTRNFFVDYEKNPGKISLRREKKRICYNTFEDFVNKTKIVYTFENDCILYRFVPIGGPDYNKTKYDGFISNQRNGQDRFGGMWDILDKKKFRKHGYKQLRTIRAGDYNSYYIVHVDLNYRHNEEVEEEDDYDDDYCEYIGTNNEDFENEL